jgi:hypothetical protein
MILCGSLWQYSHFSHPPTSSTGVNCPPLHQNGARGTLKKQVLMQ